MSLIIVQVGQCGNQVGHNLFKTIYNDCYSNDTKTNEDKFVNESIDRFFHRTKCDISIASFH